MILIIKNENFVHRKNNLYNLNVKLHFWQCRTTGNGQLPFCPDSPRLEFIVPHAFRL